MTRMRIEPHFVDHVARCLVITPTELFRLSYLMSFFLFHVCVSLSPSVPVSVPRVSSELHFILSDRIKCRHVPYTDCPTLIEYFVIRRRSSCPIPFYPLHPLFFFATARLNLGDSYCIPQFIQVCSTCSDFYSRPVFFQTFDKCQIHERVVFYLSRFIH